MLTYVLIAGIIAAAIALGGKYLLKIGWIPVLAAFAVVSFGVSPAVYAIGSNIAVNDASTFHEYWNGYETAAVKTEIVCVKDGSCVHEYNCDPYTVLVPHPHYDSKGNYTGTTYTTEVRYHDCPYSTQETTYSVDTTLAAFTIASHVMTGEPYSPFAAIPGGKQTAPKRWLEVQQRIQAGKPGPVTTVNNYTNYILAAQVDLFKKYSNQIDQLKKKSLLPSPASGVTDFYKADKAYFVGTNNIDEKSLRSSVAYLNGAVGDKLHGDVHVVFADASKVGDPTDYANALLAYWQSAELGRNAISKNAIIIVIGVGKGEIKSAPAAPVSPSEAPTNTASPMPSTVPTEAPVAPETGTVALWVKAFTGMPIGNERMLTEIESTLKNQLIDSNLIGKPSYDIKNEKIIHTHGVLEDILWGKNKFERVSMSGDGKGDGFKYLKDGVKVNAGAMASIIVLNSILGIIIYLAAGLLWFKKINLI